jgi:hypothetical protein
MSRRATTLTDAQHRALGYLSQSPYPAYDHGWRETGKHCTFPTARKLESIGLVEVKAETASWRHASTGFVRQAGLKGGVPHHTSTFIDARARLTPAGRALVESLPSPKALPKKVRLSAWQKAMANPASARANDPSLTVARLRLRRLAPGLYEHVNGPTGTTWRIFHDHGDTRGVDRWMYYRTDADAWQRRSESEAQDTYATKADAAAALVDRLNYRRA